MPGSTKINSLVKEYAELKGITEIEVEALIENHLKKEIHILKESQKYDNAHEAAMAILIPESEREEHDKKVQELIANNFAQET